MKANLNLRIDLILYGEKHCAPTAKRILSVALAVFQRNRFSETDFYRFDRKWNILLILMKIPSGRYEYCRKSGSLIL